MNDREYIIGVIGGMGPYAGLDLVRKIFDHTLSHTDQEHLPVALHSFPHRIPDRSTFLFGKSDASPVPAITGIAESLDRAGAVVAGMPCNTAHEPRIFDAVADRLKADGRRIRLIHMIEETVRYIQEERGDVRRIGLLSTLAVYRFRVYQDALEAAGLEAVLPDAVVQENIVNRTIFDEEHGIKAQSNPVTPFARQNLLSAIEHLREKGAEAVILGCTELPLAVTERRIGDVEVIDPTEVLARALIRETYPDKLRPLHANQPSMNGTI